MPIMTHRGYTLIELMVSMAIFAMVMLAATAAYLSFIAYNRQTQVTASQVNTLSYDIDGMVREVRSGTGYDNSRGSGDFCFVNSSGEVVEYVRPSSDTTKIRRIDHGSVAGGKDCSSSPVSSYDLNDDSITITAFSFQLVGASQTDKWQPTAVIKLAGTTCVPNTSCTGSGKISFAIETSATQRLPDLH
jgi:prepilin-type N-terminal cleavage/methylation domain-containing protein